MKRFDSCLMKFQNSWRVHVARQRLGVRQPSAALRGWVRGEKAAEGCRTPKPRGILKPVGVSCCLVFAWLLVSFSASAQSPTFWSWAARPVMGWNSWDFYGTSINEERTKAQTDYQSANLLSHGWSLM